MKRSILITVIAIIISIVSASTTLPQAVGRNTQLFLVLDVTLKTSTISEYETAVKEYVNLHEIHNFPYTFYGYTTNDFHYYQFFPVDNYADIDNTNREYEELARKAGKVTWQSLIKRFTNNSNNTKLFTVRYMSELSYNPENQKLMPEEQKFTHWAFCYMKRDKEQEFENICKELVDVFRRKKSPYEFNIFVGHIGTNNPLFIVQEKAVTASEFYIKSEKMFALLGDEVKVLYGKIMSSLSKIERQDGTYRPELSYIAEK